MEDKKPFYSSRQEMQAFNESKFNSDSGECWAFGWDWKREEKISQLIKILSPKSSDKILDLGCGGGIYSTKMKEKFQSAIFGSDISAQAVKIASTAGKNIHYSAAFGEFLPFRKEAFDKIYSIEVFEHLPEPIPVIHEIGRVLKKGGLCAISNPIIPTWKYPWWKLEDPKVHGHINFMTVHEYEAAFKNAGMKLVGVRGYGIMQSLVELQGRMIHSIRGGDKKDSPAPRNISKIIENEFPAESNAKKFINSYYRFLYSLDFSLLGKVPFQNSAFLIFKKI